MGRKKKRTKKSQPQVRPSPVVGAPTDHRSSQTSSLAKTLPTWAWLCWVLAALSLFYVISSQITGHFLYSQYQAEQSRLQQGLHPFFIDFAKANALRRHAGEGADIDFLNGRWQLRSTADAFDLRLNLQGRAVHLTEIAELQFAWQAENATAKETRWWWVVYDQPDQPGWIAPLPNHSVPLANLQFAKETNRSQLRSAYQLPAIRFMRLYAQAPVGSTLSFSQLSFTATATFLAQTDKTKLFAAPLVRPEQLLADFDQQRNAGQTLAAVAQPWLHAPALAWQSVILVIWLTYLLALLYLRWRAYIKPKKRDTDAQIAIWLALSIAVALALLPQHAVTTTHQAILLCLAIAALYMAVNHWEEPPTSPGLASPSLLALWLRARVKLPTPADDNGLAAIGYGTLALAGVLLIAFGLPARVPHGSRLLVYLVFATIQQILLQQLLLRRLLHSRWQVYAVLLCATLFALWHTPNFTLMVLTFVAALWWCSWYRRYQSLWPLVASHVVLGWLCVAVMPPDLLRNTQVGARYFEAGQSSR